MNILHEMIKNNSSLSQYYFNRGLVYPQFIVGEGVKWELTDLGKEVNQLLSDYARTNIYIPMKTFENHINSAKKRLSEKINLIIEKRKLE